MSVRFSIEDTKIVKRALPLWIAAVVPATIAGHALAYAISGQSATDARHAWLQPTLEISIALLIAACALLFGQTLLRAGILVHTSTERSALALWPRLAWTQLVLYTAIEFAEGARPGVSGWTVQVLTALAAALVLALFVRLLARCAAGTQAASRYLQRLLEGVAPIFSRRQSPAVFALSVCAGTSRFQRPPPRL
jgi:hypothetical protein